MGPRRATRPIPCSTLSNSKSGILRTESDEIQVAIRIVGPAMMPAQYETPGIPAFFVDDFHAAVGAPVVHNNCAIRMAGHDNRLGPIRVQKKSPGSGDLALVTDIYQDRPKILSISRSNKCGSSPMSPVLGPVVQERQCGRCCIPSLVRSCVSPFFQSSALRLLHSGGTRAGVIGMEISDTPSGC